MCFILLFESGTTYECIEYAEVFKIYCWFIIQYVLFKVLTEIKHRLRRSLNHSGVFTLSEISAAGADNIDMLYDIPMPEPLFHPDELSIQGESSCRKLSL